MEVNKYDKEFEGKKNLKLEFLKDEYLKFSNNYKDKVIATEDYLKKATKDGLALLEFEMNNSLYFDDFKIDIESKMNYVYDRFENPIQYVIKNDLAQILQKYKEQKEYNISRKQDTRFDYLFFDNFTEKDAIELFANIKAYEEFKEYLNNILYPNESSEKNNTVIKGITNHNKKRVPPIVLNYKNQKEVKNLLYEELRFFKLIDIEKDDFMKHFENNEDNFYNKIIWYGKKVELLYLFQEIKTSDATPYKIIINHFVKENNQVFKSQNLRQSLNKLKDRIQNEKTIYAKAIKFGNKKKLYINIEKICIKINSYL